MAEPKFRLPESGFGQVAKILKAYKSASRRDSAAGVKLDDIAKRTAINRTAVSANNAFLLAVGLIEGGNAKRLTPLGSQAALVLDHPGTQEAHDTWSAVVEGSPDLERILDAVRIRQGMDEDALLSHILLTAGVPKTSRWLTGARAVIELLEFAGLLVDVDGVFRVSVMQDGGLASGGGIASEEAVGVPTVTVGRATTRHGVVVNVHVWVQAADANFAELGDELKEFLAKLASE